MLKRSSIIAMSVLVLALALAFTASLFSFSAVPAIAQDEEPTATPIVAEVGGGDLEISFWNGLTGSDGVTLVEMMAGFAEENPNVSVTVEMIAWATLYQKLQTAFVAGTYPDVFMLHASEIPQYGSFGLLKDLEPWYTSGGGWFPNDDISETTMDGLIWDDTIYGIPLDNHGRGLWINVDMFEAAGLSTDPADAPTTYEGWVDLFQKLTLDADGNNALSPDFDPENVVQWGYAVGEWPRVNFQGHLAQHGGSILSEDGTTVTVNSEAGITALQQSVDLVYEYNVSPPAAGFDTWQGFGAGTVAVLPTGTWYRNQSLLQTDINSMAWPNVQFGPSKATWFGSHVWMVPAALEGEKLEAVEALIRYISENQIEWASSGQVPARLSVQAELDPENYPSNILLGQGFTEYGVQDPKTTVTQEMWVILEAELANALNGIKTAEEALNDAAELMQEALDRA